MNILNLVKKRVKKGYIVKLLTTVFIFSGLLSTLYALYSFRVWKSKAQMVECTPSCTWGFCSMGVQCCECDFGSSSNGYGPITCCDPPDHTGCSTHNVYGCNPGAPTAPPATPTPTPRLGGCVPACSPGWFCSMSTCCQCVYGQSSSGYGPVTCCNPPGGGSGCTTYNVNGCNPGTPTVPPATPTPIPLSCSVSLVPSLYTLKSNQAVNLTANVKTFGGATVNRVNFNSNTTLLKISPQADYTYVYQTTASTLKINKTTTAKVTATTYLNGTSKTCTGTSTITLSK